jgi:feruloyl esterase
LDPNIHDYYRFFQAPELGHCYGGIGAYPADIFKSLVEWVEEGKAPDELEGVVIGETDGVARSRLLCPYPQIAKYKGSGDVNVAENFICE